MEQVARKQKRVQLEHQAFELVVSRSGGDQSSSLSYLHQNSKSNYGANGQLGEMIDERLENEWPEGMDSEDEENDEKSSSEDFDVFQSCQQTSKLKQEEIMMENSSNKEQNQNSKQYDDYAESEISSSKGSGPKEVKRKIIHKDNMKINKRDAILRLQERQQQEITSVKVQEGIDHRENENNQAPNKFDSDNCIVIDKCKRLLEDQTMKMKQQLHLLEIKKQVKKLYENRMKLSEISQKLQISTSILKKWINQKDRQSKRKSAFLQQTQGKVCNYDMPNQIGFSRLSRVKVKVQKRNQINFIKARNLYEQGFTFNQISEKLKITISTIYLWMRKINKQKRDGQKLVKKQQQKRRQPALNKKQKQRSQVWRRSTWKIQQTYSEQTKERIVQKFYLQKKKNISGFALQMHIPYSTFWRWVRDHQKRTFLNSFSLDQKQAKTLFLDSFVEGSALEYNDIRKCMSSFNSKALSVPNSWIDSFVQQYNLDYYFKILKKKIELKEEDE